MTASAWQGRISSFISSLIYSNIITAVAGSTLTLLTFLLLAYPIKLSLLLVVFSGTLLIYTFNRFTDIREDAINLPKRVQFIRMYGQAMLIIAVLLYGISLVMVALHSSLAALVAVFPLMIAFLYSYFRLKRFFLVKNFLICSGWVCSVLVVGAYYHEFGITLILLMILVFIAGFVNSIIFDIKDLKGDTLCNIQTFPVKYGIRKTKYCCYLLLIPPFLIAIYLITLDIRSAILLPFLGYITSYTYFLDSSDQCPEWYFGLYVDGEYIFLLFCIFIFYHVGAFTAP